MTMRTPTPKEAAQKADDAAFEMYLQENKSTAASCVPQAVIDAARAAYASAGGTRTIVVRGYGNPTYHVCSVTVVFA